MQRVFACHLRDVGRVYQASHFPRVVVTVDNAPWHRGPRIRTARSQVPHVQLFPLHSYSPQLNPVERLWKLLRHRATHNRLFDDSAHLQRTLAQHLSWLQKHREHVRSAVGAAG